MKQAIQIPDGYKQDTKGNLVPLSNIRPIDTLRDDLVRELVESAEKLQAQIRKFRDDAFADIGTFVEVSAERYNTVVGGKKGNVTLYSFDGKYKIQRDINEHLKFDEGILAAKALIHECLEEWTEGSPDALKALVNKAFEVDAEGNLSTNRVLGLRRVNIADERWVRAMDAISDAIQVIGSKAYIRIYKRVGDSDKYEPIALNIAASGGR